MPTPLAEVSMASEKSSMPFYLSSEQALQEYLESSGVNTSKFGKGNAKPLAWLYQELQEGTCYLECPHPLSPTSPGAPRSSRLLRVVEPIFIRLRFRSRVLVQEKQQFPDGRLRVRNMLLAEKKEPRDSGGPLSTIHRAIHEELGVSMEDLRRDDVMQYRPDTYHFEIEHIDSPSYPGLASAYRTHHVQVDILETGLDTFMHCGLPEFSDFVTKEQTSHGEITLFWRWDDVNTALKRGVVKFPPKSLAPTMTRPSLKSVKSTGSLEAPEKSVLAANLLKDGGLAIYLKKAGIDPDAYGKDKAKSLDSLIKEVEAGETVLEWNEQTNQIRRIVEPVFVQFRWNDKVLVEHEQIMADGRKRARNMLLAEKKKPEDTEVEQTVYRGLAEELLENYAEFVPDVSFHVRFMQEAYCCVAENLESSSYPGLPCVYITHYCAVQLLDSALPIFQEIGMLEPEFDTTEEDGKVNRWRWIDLDEARKNKVKGFPKLEESQNADNVGLWQLIESSPADIGDLRVLLEMGGVNVSAWGVYTQESLKSLLQEIQSGASALERDDISGKVRRVICSSLVQLKVDGPKERELLNGLPGGFDLGDARSMVNYRADRGVWEVLHSDTASYPGLPCCYQTRLVQFESLKREALRKLPSDVIEKLGAENQASRRNSQRSSQTSSLAVPLSGFMSPSSGQSVNSSLPGSLDESPMKSKQNIQADPKAELVDLPADAVGIYRQVLHMHKDLRFRMVAKEASEKSVSPAQHAVACSCEILLIRNINPLTATYQCRFYIFMEWFDQAAIGMPPGDVSEENRKKLWIPEIALQNTLKTGVEIHYPPEIIFSEKGHVAAKVLYQAIMQMEIDMRLFPFDTQRLNIVLGLRARRDRDRAVFCRFCHVDSSIRLDEWKLMGAFHHTDRPDGRARVQFGVIIGRGYMYYVLNVLITLFCIASSSFAGYLLQLKPPFDRLRFCISILFAQTTFRLSIDSKLPIVAYATAFDHFAMCCQLLLLSIILGDVIVVMISDRWFGFGGEAAAEVVDMVVFSTLLPTWIFALVGFSMWVVRKRREHQHVLNFGNDEIANDNNDHKEDTSDFSSDAVEQIARLKGRLRYTSARRLSPTEVSISTDAVAVSTMVWFIHDIDPIQAQYECKFTAYIEWISPNAVGLPEQRRLSKEELISLNMPEIDVRNKVELQVDQGPDAYITDTTVGRIMVSTRYVAKLQLRLKLRNFPFDKQSLPIDFVMPAEKDNQRAFIFRSCELAPLAKNLDEWTVKGTSTKCDFHEGMSQAAMYVQVERHAKYYVVSVLAVMLGISSLVFTVFSIDVDSNGRGFDDQGKILIPLLMTLLAFKLLTASGKIPKVAKATIFDRYVLASEACFFVTVFSCSLLRGMITAGPEMAKLAGILRASFGMVLMLAWLSFNILMAREVQHAKAEDSTEVSRSSVHIPGFDAACKKILQKPLIPTCTLKPKAVLMEISIKHVFAINPAAANFTCEFEVSMAWLDNMAKQMPSGTKLDKDKCQKLGLPKLSVQNAQSSTIKFESGRIIDSQSGHVACKMKIKAQVLMTFDLRYFPWDEQSLFVVLVLTSQEDANRYLVLSKCVSTESVKAGEWNEVGSFAKSYSTGGTSKAVFGLQISRFSRYYVTSLGSLCLWSSFILLVYALAVNDFRERGKIMVGVLLVQNVAKVAVSSKMPRVVRITAYDNVALNSLALLFSIGIFNALLDALGQVNIPGLSFEVLTVVDRCVGIVVFIAWVLANLYVMVDVWRNHTDAAAVKAGKLPRQLAGFVPSDFVEPAEVLEDIDVINRTPDPLSIDSRVRKTTSRSSDILGELIPVKLGVKFWLISDIDVASATYLAKFHVILEWFDQAAVGLPVSTRISYEKLCSDRGRDNVIAVPHVGLKNAITVSLEEYSDIIVLESKKGLVTCRVHFNASLHNEFCLDCFPFDCQRLLAELYLANTEGFELVPNFCNAGEQLKTLDGWNFTTAALAQPDTETRANRQRVLVNIILERQSGFFVKQVLSIYWFLTTLMFSFFVLAPEDFTKRLVDILKIVLTQTTFRFSVEHRLPKVQVWTPFDAYLISCQILCCFIAMSYLVCFIMSQSSVSACLTEEMERRFLVILASCWVVWNLAFIVYATFRKRRERYLIQQSILGALEVSRFSNLLPRYSKSQSASALKVKRKASDGEDPVTPNFSVRGTGTGVEAFTGHMVHETQVISIAFRIWLIRNVDLVKATFECKFRVFLEWLDDGAIGLEKGKKAKELKVPSLAITNAVQAEVLDRSSAPEVVNPATGHVAVQMLFRATLRMDQQVRHFPFDCQWLAVTVSLKEEGCAQNRSFVFQYCEVDEGLSLDEWYICPDPAFSTLTKQDAPSIQDTVMCGLLIRRASRYYVVNIMLMLGLISSIAFAIYTVHVSLFWERAEVFLGIFPLIVIFKMSAQAKLPRVGYSTKFDRFATACQTLFLVIVMGCMAMSFISNVPTWFRSCDSVDTAAFGEQALLAEVEHVCCYILIGFWLSWIIWFSWQARQVQRLDPVANMQSRIPVKLQGRQGAPNGSTEASVEGLAPSLSIVAQEEKKRTRKRPSLLVALGIVDEKEKQG